MGSWTWKHFINCKVLNIFSCVLLFVSSIDLWDRQDTESSQNFPLRLYSWFAPLNPVHQQQNKDDKCHPFLQGSLQYSSNLPVPSYLPQVLYVTKRSPGQRSSTCRSCIVLSAHAVLSTWDGMWNSSILKAFFKNPYEAIPAIPLLSWICKCFPFFDSAY